MVRPTDTKETEMNVQETTGIRELTVEELDHVTGGFTYGMTNGEAGFLTGVFTFVVGGAIMGLLDWLFG